VQTCLVLVEYLVVPGTVAVEVMTELMVLDEVIVSLAVLAVVL
jgi:hypothetical protein